MELPTVSYEKQFENLRNQNKEDKLYRLFGDVILVERIEVKEVKTKSGLVIAQTPEQRLNNYYENACAFVRVLDIGEGYYDSEDNSTVPLDCEPGNILLVGEMSTSWFSVFHNLQDYKPNSIGLVRESEIRMRFQNQDALDKTFQTLNN